MKHTDIEENESNLDFSQNMKVSQKEIAKRIILYKYALGSIGVGDNSINLKNRSCILIPNVSNIAPHLK